MDKSVKYNKAKRRVFLIKIFYFHLSLYIIVNLGLFMINMLSKSDSLWFLWPITGWGIGLLIHAFLVFGISGILGKDWEDKKIKEFMGK